MAHQHQRHHEDVLRDGHAVGTGGVGQHHGGGGVQGFVQIGVDPGKAAAEPFQAGEALQLARLGHAVDDLVFAAPLLGTDWGAG